MTTIILFKCVLIALLFYTVVRIYRARKHDPLLKIRFTGRSLAEVIAVAGLNILVLVLPYEVLGEGVTSFLSIAAIILSYYHFNRYVFLGKKIIYLREHAFRIQDVSGVWYEKGILTLNIKNQPLRVRFPLGDIKSFIEFFSGKRFR